MLCSIVIATYNKDTYLEKTLNSIFSQKPKTSFEVIIIDDGSNDNTSWICCRYPVTYIRTDNTEYRNPSKARNIGYRQADGDIIIAQSDEVIHTTPNSIDNLCSALQYGFFCIATVFNYKNRQVLEEYTGLNNQRPLFFLGSLYKKDLYAIGGNDEEFIEPGYDDNWFADCLIYGLNLKPKYLDHVIGYHQDHPRPANLAARMYKSKILYDLKKSQGIWCALGGSW